MFSGEVPKSCKPAIFMMLAKSRHAIVPADYTPITSVRLFNKMFAYMFVRVEPATKIHQPEEQQRFRTGHRVVEHLLIAKMVVDKMARGHHPLFGS